jgi:hypothetical protein
VHVKEGDDNVYLAEFTLIKAENNDLLNQIMQYFRNAISKVEK